jgi:deoxycytidine triphosphate deaminase
MNLTGKQLAEQGIITNLTEENISQHGVDLNVIKIERIFGIGRIPKTGKTRLVSYKEVEQVPLIISVEEDGLIETSGWQLSPGTYQVTFKQGCNVPADKMLLLRQRSSMARNGAISHSSVFDAGFKTDNIGTMIIVTHPIEIEYEARIVQIYSHNSNVVENLYVGQFQGDKQRDSK